VTAKQVFDTGERIPFRISTRGRTGRKIDSYSLIREKVGCEVLTVSAVKRIAPLAAEQNIVSALSV